MARERDAVCKKCRREGIKLFLKGERCLTPKCAIERRPFPPGEHGRKPSRKSEYSAQLREKQKAKHIYGVLEKQFKNYYLKASRKKGITGENLLRLLEMRLDNIVYRMGFAFSRREARQFVKHGHFLVNGKKLDVPSAQLSPGDVVSLSESGKKVARIAEALNSDLKPEVPSWLEVDVKKMEGKVLNYPSREDIDVPVNEQLIVEFYSK